MTIDISQLTPRQQGQEAAEACAEKAERLTYFDTSRAAAYVLTYLRRHGATPGEVLVDSAIAVGMKPHDSRAFGAVFAKLSRVGLIRCTGYCERRKGRGTAGGRIWAAA